MHAAKEAEILDTKRNELFKHTITHRKGKGVRTARQNKKSRQTKQTFTVDTIYALWVIGLWLHSHTVNVYCIYNRTVYLNRPKYQLAKLNMKTETCRKKLSIIYRLNMTNNHAHIRRRMTSYTNVEKVCSQTAELLLTKISCIR
jgi:hypothetical protein